MRPTRPATLPAAIALVALLVASLALPAAAQQPGMPAGWGLATPNQAAWRPDLFADYLLTGQTPHPSVARIVAPDDGGVSLGSGVLVDINGTQGLVLTNWHVIRDTKSAVLVQFPEGFQSAGTVIRQDEVWDLAALVIWKPRATPISLAEHPPQIGEPLTIAGFGRGAYRAETGACTEYLSPGTGYAKDLVELAATARQGDSGGPILNADGKLAGVLFGQNSGRTIGSCSTQVRAFLASVGSAGFAPPMVASATGRSAVGGASIMPVQLQPSSMRSAAAAPLEPSMQQSMHVDGMGLPPSAAELPAAPEGGMRAIAEFFDVTRNRQTLLSVAGGLALVILGLGTIIASRPAPRRSIG
ncbi:MAG: serine protease [Planctomycetia bacterium]